MAVRRESVLLTLEDQFSTGMARAAAATALLSRNLHDLDGTSADAADGMRGFGDETDRVDKSNRRTGDSINQLTGRLSLLRDVAVTLGPALVPLGAGAVGGMVGMAAQFGAAAGAIGVTVAAFNGLGDALKAVNAAQLEPTADNLAKMRLELEKIGPDAARFAMYLQEIEPEMRALQMTARAGIFPGQEDGIDALLTRGPQLQSIVANIANALGDMAEATGEGLGGPRFDAFFDYVESEAGPALRELGNSIGYVGEGLANMMVAFAPVSSDFSAGLEGMARSFAEWSRTLDSNESFQEFVDYIRENGPQALDFLGSLVEAFAAIVQAAAPIGDVVLPVLTALLDLFADIAGTDFGTTLLAGAAAISVYSRAVQGLGAVSKGLQTGVLGGTAAVKSFEAAQKAATPTLSQFGTVLYRAGQSAEHATEKTNAARAAVAPYRAAFGQAAAGVGLLALSMTDLDEKVGLGNTAMGAMAGFMVGGPWGAAIGGGIGLAADFAQANNDVSEALDRVEASLARVAGKTASPFDAAQMTKELNEASAALDELVRRTNSGDLDDAIVGSKDLIEGWFGSSDVEEAAKRFEEAQARVQSAVIDTKNAAADAAADQSYRRWLEAETAALEANIAAMRAKREEALRGINATLDYSSAVLDARDAVAENGRTLDRNTRAGLDNWRALTGLAAAWNGQSDAAKNADGAHKRARATFIQVAQQMGMNAAEARRYADRLMEIPPERKTKITMESSVAMQQIAAVRSAIASIKDKTIQVRVEQIYSRTGGTYSADGGTVPKTGLPYADRHPYILADGEEVISNRYGQADRHRALLKAINAGRLADGGTAGGYVPGVTPSSAVGMGVGIAQANYATTVERSTRALDAELRVRARLLDKELQASRERLDAMKQERDSIVSTVKARLTTSELFTQGGSSDYATLRPGNFDDLDSESQKAILAQEFAYNQSLGFGQTTSPVDVLRADMERAKKERALIQQLKQRGLSGGALQAAITQDGGLEGAAGLSQQELVQFERLYNRREQLVGNVAGGAGDAVFGKAIDRVAGHVRETNQELRLLNARIDKLERTGPERTGRAAGEAVRNEAAKGARSRS